MKKYENAWVMTAQLNEKKDGCELCMRPLVLCKDCRNAVVYDDNEVVCAHIDSNGNDKHPADWFCADGRRRDE